MPRGSKPGERRGGRQRGTPNKSTLLKHAAIKAAATDPNLSPLGQADLPLRLRVTVAQQALPFAHAKPKPDRPIKGTDGGSRMPRIFGQNGSYQRPCRGILVPRLQPAFTIARRSDFR
jgi:hypothetical protein